jgi:hypothetical protein
MPNIMPNIVFASARRRSDPTVRFARRSFDDAFRSQLKG